LAIGNAVNPSELVSDPAEHMEETFQVDFWLAQPQGPVVKTPQARRKCRSFDADYSWVHLVLRFGINNFQGT